MNNDKFFIYAGPPKTASTWLYAILCEHPEVEMPLRKELRYFEFLDKVGNVSLLHRILGQHPFLKRERKLFLFHLKQRIKRVKKTNYKDWGALRNFLNHFFANWNDEWYSNQFSNDKVSGDISPTYCSLSEDTIKKVKAFNPKTKIIIGLRNPIERQWSGVKMRLVRRKGKKSIEEVNTQELKNALSHSDADFQDYTSLLKKMGGEFPDNQMLIYYYEELREDPQKLYNKICKFLEIQPMKIEGIEKVINKGKTDKITTEYEKIIVEANYKYIKKFAENYPNKYSLAWLEKYRYYEQK